MIKTHTARGYQLTKNDSWDIGATVKVGFVSGLKVLSVKPGPKGQPNVYALEGTKGRLYDFMPHRGLRRIN